MKIQTYLSGGVKTWGMILLFAWILSTLKIIYDWFYNASREISNSFCQQNSYITSIVP